MPPRVGNEFGISNMEFSLDQILGAETFLELEKALQGLVEESLIAGASEKLVEIAKSHQSSFWSEQMPDTLARWSLIAAAGQVSVRGRQDREGDQIISRRRQIILGFIHLWRSSLVPAGYQPQDHGTEIPRFQLPGCQRST